MFTDKDVSLSFDALCGTRAKDKRCLNVPFGLWNVRRIGKLLTDVSDMIPVFVLNKNC